MCSHTLKAVIAYASCAPLASFPPHNRSEKQVLQDPTPPAAPPPNPLPAGTQKVPHRSKRHRKETDRQVRSWSHLLWSVQSFLFTLHHLPVTSVCARLGPAGSPRTDRKHLRTMAQIKAASFICPEITEGLVPANVLSRKQLFKLRLWPQLNPLLTPRSAQLHHCTLALAEKRPCHPKGPEVLCHGGCSRHRFLMLCQL